MERKIIIANVNITIVENYSKGKDTSLATLQEMELYMKGENND